MQNPTDEDIVVYVEVENVEIRISDESAPNHITFKAEVLEIHEDIFWLHQRQAGHSIALTKLKFL